MQDICKAAIFDGELRIPMTSFWNGRLGFHNYVVAKISSTIMFLL